MTSSRLRRWARRQTDFLASGRLAVWLIAAVALVLAAHVLLPQQAEVGPAGVQRWVEANGAAAEAARALGLTRVLDTGLFWVPYALMLVNLSLCMLRRLRSTAGFWRMPATPPSPALSWLRRDPLASPLDAAGVAAVLRRRGYRTCADGGIVYGLRGRFALAGHWIFHLTLLVLLVGGLRIAAAPSPFRGYVGVGEGESFDLHDSRFLASNRPADASLPALRFRLERIDVDVEDGKVRHFEAHLATPGGGRAQLGINRPYRQAPYQVLGRGLGYMAGWVVVDAKGSMLSGAWVKLAPFGSDERDSFPLGPEGATVHLRLHPDHQETPEGHGTRSLELRNPRFETRVVWQGERIYEGLLVPGERVALEPGRSFFFLPEIRRYGLFDVIQEAAQAFVFACLGAMIVGLLVRYARLRKEVIVRVDNGTLQVFGRGEILESLFAEELEALAAELGGPSGSDASP